MARPSVHARYREEDYKATGEQNLQRTKSIEQIYSLTNHTRGAISFKCKISVWLFINRKAVYMVKTKLCKVHVARNGVTIQEFVRKAPLLCKRADKSSSEVLSARPHTYAPSLAGRVGSQGEPPEVATLQLKMQAICPKIFAFFI